MATGGRTSFLLFFQITSPPLTQKMTKSVGIHVDEIVSTIDTSQSVQCTYIHLKVKTREGDIKQAVQTLTLTCGLQEYNVDGHSMITSNSIDSAQNIEDHPGFVMLISHETSGNINFHRWTDEKYHQKRAFGYNLLKNKLSTCINETSINAKGIYVLSVDNRPKSFFYVGKANDIIKRIKQHADGEGAYCMTGEPFTRVDPITRGIYFIIMQLSKYNTHLEIQGQLTTWNHGSEMKCLLECMSLELTTYVAGCIRSKRCLWTRSFQHSTKSARNSTSAVNVDATPISYATAGPCRRICGRVGWSCAQRTMG